MRPIQNEAEAEREIENEAETEVSGDNMVEGNPVEENLGGMNSQAATPGEWVVPVLEKSETVKLVSFTIDKLTKLNVRDWKNQMQRFLRMQDCWRVAELTEELKDQPEKLGIGEWPI